MPIPPIFTNYLRRLGMTSPLITRASEVYEFYRILVPGPIPGIFVSEYATADGTRQYENLWFFTRRFAMEAKSFVTADNFDIAPYGRRLAALVVRKEDYDFRKAKEGSRLSVDCVDESAVTYSLRASGLNCDSLRDIVRKFFVPNLTGSGSGTLG
jgi:hypothetical protein